MADEENEIVPGSEPAQPEAPAPVDDWAAAFAALEPKDEKPAEADAGDREGGATGAVEEPAPAEGAAGVEPGAASQAPAVDVAEGVQGGPASGGDGADAGSGSEPEFAPEAVRQQVESLRKGVEQQAMKEVRDLFIQKNIRHDSKGRLGATINDADIYKRDENGVPVFYNPDTGQPFTGDNPRAQARQWVQDYNEELKDTYNRMVQDKIDSLSEGIQPTVQMLEFLPTFTKLDPVRKQLLESLIEDYEVKDNDGNPVGYSCDLNKALAQVNRQVEAIRQSQAQPVQKQTPTASKPKTSPATDMRTGSSATGANQKPQFNSIAEAMEWEQDQQLEAMRKKGKR